MKKKLLLFVFSLLSSLTASAYDAEVDGIYYNLITKVKQAIVTSGDSKYTGVVTIPETITYNDVTYNVTSIGKRAFSGCTGLTKVTIPSSVTIIEESAFSSCSSLKSVTLPNSVTEIGDDAFLYCSSLTAVHITDIAAWCKISFSDYSSNPLNYANHLFMDGEEIKDLVIPNSVTSIGEYAFSDCTGLTSVTIPNSVTSIGKYAFSDCTGLTSVHITDMQAWCKISFEQISSNPLVYAKHLFIDGKEIKDLIIPNNVTSIGAYAFYRCSGIKSVTIPSSVTKIGGFAFSGCSGLTSVTIPNNLTYIVGNAFRGCSSLTSVTIPNSVTSIGGEAFYSCSGMTSVIIGNGVKNIYNSAFANCSELADVYCYAEKVPSTDSNAFKDSYIEYATLYVPEASVAAYKAAEPWSGFGTIKTLSGEIPVTPKCATPTIAFIDGKLSVDCETEDVKYVYNIVPMSPMSGEGLDIALPTSFKVTIYATKDGYENSEVATREIKVDGTAGLRGDLNGDGTVSMPDAMFIVNKILNGKFPDEE